MRWPPVTVIMTLLSSLQVNRTYIIEWNERKGDHIFEMVEYYEKATAKVSNELHKIISFSDPIVVFFLNEYHLRKR